MTDLKKQLELGFPEALALYNAGYPEQPREFPFSEKLKQVMLPSTVEARQLVLPLGAKIDVEKDLLDTAEEALEALGATQGEADWRAEEASLKGPLTREDLLMLHDSLAREARNLMSRKNQDYASRKDPFRNFRRHGALGVLVRLSDKLARLEGFIETETLAVTDETIRDTVLDIINYAVLFMGILLDERRG